METTTLLSIIIIVLLILLFLDSRKETLISPAVEGVPGYVKFYKDFAYKDLLFEMEKRDESKDIEYFKYLYRGDIRSMNLNLPKEGPPGRKIDIWAYRYFSPTATTTSDFYNIYQIPEYHYKNHPNLNLVASIKPGQQFKSNDIYPAKKFLLNIRL